MDWFKNLINKPKSGGGGSGGSSSTTTITATPTSTITPNTPKSHSQHHNNNDDDDDFVIHGLDKIEDVSFPSDKSGKQLNHMFYQFLKQVISSSSSSSSEEEEATTTTIIQKNHMEKNGDNNNNSSSSDDNDDHTSQEKLDPEMISSVIDTIQFDSLSQESQKLWNLLLTELLATYGQQLSHSSLFMLMISGGGGAGVVGSHNSLLGTSSSSGGGSVSGTHLFGSPTTPSATSSTASAAAAAAIKNYRRISSGANLLNPYQIHSMSSHLLNHPLTNSSTTTTTTTTTTTATTTSTATNAPNLTIGIPTNQNPSQQSQQQSKEHIFGFPIQLIRLISVYMTQMEPLFSKEIMNTSAIPTIPNVLRVIAMLTPLHSIQLLHYFQVLNPIFEITQNMIHRAEQLLEDDTQQQDSNNLEFELRVLEMLSQIFFNFTMLKPVLRQSRPKQLFIDLLSVLVDLSNKKRGGCTILKVIYAYLELISSLDGGESLHGDICCKLLGWPLRFIDWSFDSKCTDLTQPVLESETEREYAQLYYDIQTCTLRTIAHAAKRNPKILHSLYKSGFLERMEEMGLWVSVFFHNWKNTESETISATLRENSIPNVFLKVRSLDNPNQQGEWYSRPPAANHVSDLSPEHYPCPGFIRKTTNEKYLYYWTLVTDFLAVEGGTDDFINLIFNFWREYDSDAKKKLKKLSDFQFYFLDKIFLAVSSTPHVLEPFIEHGLYDILFSEYFYFFQFPMKNDKSPTIEDDNLYSESSSLQKLTAVILRDSVISFFKYVATRGSSNVKEVRKLTEILHEYSSQPVVLNEIGACLLDICYHQMEITRMAFNMAELSIISHVLAALQTKITAIEQQKKPRSSIDYVLDAEIGTAMALNPSHMKALSARNTLLHLFDIQICNEANESMVVYDENVLKCLFTCIFDSSLSDFVLNHVRRLLNSQVDDARNFENILAKIIDVFPRMVTDATDDSIQLLMRTLVVVQEVFEGPNRKLLQSQMRSKLDSFIFMLNFQICTKTTTVTQHDLCIQVIKTLTSLVLENNKSKKFLQESVGYDALRDLILQCEDNKPTSELYDELFNMLVDGKFDMNTRFRIANYGIVRVMFQLCKNCPDTFVHSFLTKFITLVQKSTHNRNVCCSAHLVSVLLELLPHYDQPKYFVDAETTRKSFKKHTGILNLIIDLIEELGKHSITVAELKTFFSLIKDRSERVQNVRLLSLLLQSLHNMTTGEPESFFDFDGKNSGMLLPKMDSRIFSTARNGYTFTFWIQVETFDGRHSPRIISLIGDDNCGVEVYFEKQLLRVAVGKNVVTFDYRFETKKWYFISLVHSAGKGSFPFSSKSEIQLYIDGRCFRRVPLKLANTHSPLLKCMIGSRCGGAVDSRHFMHQGQMASIYLFSDALSQSVIWGLYLLGPNYGSSFHPTDRRLLKENSLGRDREDVDETTLFDGSLSQKIIFCYSPSAQHEHSRVVVNNIPISFYYQQYVQHSLVDPQNVLTDGPDALFIASHPAKLSSGTQLCVTHNISDIISCLGGLKILFPLFLQIDELSLSSEEGAMATAVSKNQRGTNLVNSLIELLLHLLKDSHDNQEDMARGHGFQVIGFLLKRISPTHLTDQTISMIPKLLHRVREHETLYAETMLYILYDMRLWIYTKSDIQKKFFMQLIQEAEDWDKDALLGEAFDGVSNRSRFRAVIGVQKIVDILRWYYWFDKKELDLILGAEKIINPITGAVLGERPSPVQVGEIRTFLLRLLKTMIKSSNTDDNRTKKKPSSVSSPADDSSQQTLVLDRMSAEELQALLHFLADCKDVPQLIDMTQFVLEILLSNQGPTIAEDMGTLGAYEVFLQLLYVAPSEQVRILGLKCIGRLLCLNPALRKKTGAENATGFAVATSILSRYWFTENVYRVMRDVFLGRIFLTDQGPLTSALQHSTDKKMTISSNTRFELPTVLCSIFKLMMHAALDIRVILLQDLKAYFEISDIQHVLLSMKLWQPWLLDLIVDDGSLLMQKHAEYEEDEPDVLTMDTKNKILSKCCEILIDILGLVLFTALTEIKQGWRHVEETMGHLFFYEEKKKLLDSRGVTSAIISRILDHYQNSITRKTVCVNFNDKNSPVLENLLHFATFAEEALFYNYTVNTQLKNVTWMKRAEAPSSTSLVANPLGVFKGIVGRGESTVTTPISEPNSPRSVVSTGKSELMFHDNNSEVTPSTPTLDAKQRSASPSSSPPKTNELVRMDSQKRIQRKSSSPSKIYDVENEINQRRDYATKQWLDLPIIQKLINILKQFNLASIANFNRLGNIVQGSQRLRVGGSLRLTLRLIRYALRESESIQMNHLDTIRMINKRDMENEKEIQKFSELWAVTGDLEEVDDFTTRLLYMLAFLFDALGKCLDIDSSEEAHLVINCIKDLFVTRKKLLESKLLTTDDRKPILKQSCFLFSSPSKNDLDDYRELMKDRLWNHAWKNYFQAAVRKVEEEEALFLTPLLRRRQVVFSRLYTDVTQAENNIHDFFDAQMKVFENKITQIRTIEHQRSLNQRQKYDEYDVIGSRLWKRTIQDVADQRGPWGKNNDNSPVKWKLDKTLTSRKIRLRLKRDYSTVDHSGAAHYLDKHRGHHSSSNSQSSEPEVSDQLSSEVLMNNLLQIKGQLGAFKIPKLAIVKDEDQPETIEDEKEDEKIVMEDENQFAQEKTIMVVYCELITPMQAFSGKLEFTTARLMWFGDKENKCFVFGANDETRKLTKKPKDKVWKLDTLQEMHLRRYRLQNSAIEIFLTDQTSLLFNFEKKDRNILYKKILQLKPPKLVYANALSSPADNVSRTNITKMWVKGQISNFDYLMLLNMHAGRTYNDLSQYPIFPWVIRDYTSQTLDLDDPSIYRDMTLPVGALNETRHESLQMRYQTSLGPEIPPFHYGSHYSSAGIVVYFLVRIEPYTTYFRILQGGKFDLPDRMFGSVAQTFENLLHSSDFKELIPEFYYNGDFLRVHNNVDLGTRQNGVSLGDAILPPWASSIEEFIKINRAALESDYISQRLHHWIDLIFGYKQQGEEAVKALNVFYHLTYEGSADIDKIEEPEMKRAIIAQIENFGQTPSVLFTKPHPKRMERTATTHLPRVMSTLSLLDQSNMDHASAINMSMSDPLVDLQIQPPKQVSPNRSPIVYIKLLQNSSSNNPRLCVIAQDGLVHVSKIPYQANSPLLLPTTQSVQSLLSDPLFLNPQNCKSVGFPLLLPSKKTKSVNTKCDDPALLGADTYALLLNSQCFAVPAIVNKETDLSVFSCYHWDHSVRYSKPFAPNPLSAIKVSLCPQTAMRRHKDKVTCCTICEKNEILVTGSRDTTVIVWNIHDAQHPTQSHILYGHDDSVTCIAADSDLDMVLSGSRDGTCIVHSLRKGAYIRTIKHPRGHPVSLVAIANVEQSFTIAGKVNPNLMPFSRGYQSILVGHIIMYSPIDNVIYMFNVNGEKVAELSTEGELLYTMITWDCTYILAGGESGVVYIIRLSDLQVVKTYDLRETHGRHIGKIRSLCVTDDGSCLFVGLEDGRIVVLNHDPNNRPLTT